MKEKARCGRLLQGSLFGGLSLSRMARVLFALLPALVATFALVGCEEKKAASTAAAPPEVEVATVVQMDVPVISDWIGSTDGVVNAKIRPQVSGYLLQRRYKEGSYVKKGDLLFEIDPRPFVAELDQAKGKLAQARAKCVTSAAYVKRYEPLANQGVITPQQLDDTIQTNLGDRAAMQAAQAQVEQAELNLAFTKLYSPIDGIAGSANAQLGDLVGPSGGTELTTVSTLDPIKVTFPVSEQEYLAAAQEIVQAKGQVERPRMSLSLILTDGTVFPHEGRFSFAERQVDVKTGTIRLSAEFPNPQYILRPGQFARVRARTDVKKGALLVPQRAVTELQGGSLLAVVGPDNKVSIRPVKVGVRHGNMWVVEEGLKPGERVVVEGTQKVRNGATIVVKQVEAKPVAKPAAPAGGKE